MVLKERKQYDKQRYKDNKEKILKHYKQYREDNPGKERIRHIKALYGLSYRDWLQIWKEQEGKCAICGKVFKSPSHSCVDHNHKTGEVRGLLCRMCNIGLGHFYDDSVLLEKAQKYLTH